MFSFVIEKGKTRKSRNEIRLSSINESNLQNIKKALKDYSINSKIFGPWKNGTGSLYYCLTIKNYKEVLNGTEF